MSDEVVAGQDSGAAPVELFREVPRSRMESGPVQFGDDWPGVFFRGDNALHFSLILGEFLRDHGDEGIQTEVLKGLASELLACRQGSPQTPELLRPYHECVAGERMVPEKHALEAASQMLRGTATLFSPNSGWHAAIDALEGRPWTAEHEAHRDAEAEAGTMISAREMETRHILRVLVAVKGNKSKAARVLKLDRRTLYRKLAAISKAGV